MNLTRFMTPFIYADNLGILLIASVHFSHDRFVLWPMMWLRFRAGGSHVPEWPSRTRQETWHHRPPPIPTLSRRWDYPRTDVCTYSAQMVRLSPNWHPYLFCPEGETIPELTPVPILPRWWDYSRPDVCTYSTQKVRLTNWHLYLFCPDGETISDLTFAVCTYSAQMVRLFQTWRLQFAPILPRWWDNPLTDTRTDSAQKVRLCTSMRPDLTSVPILSRKWYQHHIFRTDVCFNDIDIDRRICALLLDRWFGTASAF